MKIKMKFSDLDFQPHSIGTGVQAIQFFDNGYGVSVVKFYGSYGYEQGLYELAVLKGVDEDYQICYDTPITDDVLGYQTPEEIEQLLEKVESL
jgi:hypothetical protein